MSLAVIDANLDGTIVSLRAEGGLIVALGPDVQAGPGDVVIDADGMAVMPPMVNAHSHAAMTLFRSFGDDLPLMTWLETRIWPAEAKLEADDVYWGTRLACLEMVRSGTTSFADMYWHAGAVGRAVHDAGIRATVSAPLIDVGSADQGAGMRQAALDAIDELADYAEGGRVEAGLAPHAVYTASPDMLRWVAETAGERDLVVQIHLAETRREVDDCVTATSHRPAELLDVCGVLGPRVITAHGCWLEPHELALLSERGTTVAMCPVSNMKLAVGRHFPYPEAQQAGLALGLGTDGAASNNSLDLFGDVKVMALAQKFSADDPSVLPASEALAIARGQRSSLLGGTALAVGARADLLLVRLDLPEVAPGELDANLVYAATGAVVDTTIVAGEVLMRGRIVPGADEVVARAAERAARVTR